MSVEVINKSIDRGWVRAVILDFDGTSSLIRQGWQQVMVPMVVDVLLGTPEADPEDALRETVTDCVTALTGKQVIYQMLRLCEEVEKRGGTPRSALEYKRQYLEMLWSRLKERLLSLESGDASADGLLVPGETAALEELTDRGAEMHLASGTDHETVLREARALGLAQYFGGRIYGALDDYWKLSKAQLITEIIRELRLSGPEFVGIGDGPVEIGNTENVGGIAVGVASEEARRTGIDEWERGRRIEAAADLIAPDFTEAAEPVTCLWGETGVV